MDNNNENLPMNTKPHEFKVAGMVNTFCNQIVLGKKKIGTLET